MYLHIEITEAHKHPVHKEEEEEEELLKYKNVSRKVGKIVILIT
jgi:hypothetical protein